MQTTPREPSLGAVSIRRQNLYQLWGKLGAEGVNDAALIEYRHVSTSSRSAGDKWGMDWFKLKGVDLTELADRFEAARERFEREDSG